MFRNRKCCIGQLKGQSEFFLMNYLFLFQNHWTRKYAKNGPQKQDFPVNFQACTIRRIVYMKVGYRMSDSLSDYPTIKKSDYPLPVRALDNPQTSNKICCPYYLYVVLQITVWTTQHIIPTHSCLYSDRVRKKRPILFPEKGSCIVYKGGRYYYLYNVCM